MRSQSRHHQKPFFLYLGRNVGLPVSLEGALKLKEISYIPTEAYSAGRDEAWPDRPTRLRDAGGVYCDRPLMCTRRWSRTFRRFGARNAQVIAIATDGNERHPASRG